MNRKEKLIARFLSMPSGFRYDEMVKLPGYFYYEEVIKGKTSGYIAGNGGKFIIE